MHGNKYIQYLKLDVYCMANYEQELTVLAKINIVNKTLTNTHHISTVINSYQ